MRKTCRPTGVTARCWYVWISVRSGHRSACRSGANWLQVGSVAANFVRGSDGFVRGWDGLKAVPYRTPSVGNALQDVPTRYATQIRRASVYGRANAMNSPE